MDSVYQFSSDWINQFEGKRHWMYYWYQLEMLLENITKEDKILEIGVGTKFTSNYLKSKGYNVTTLDIDKDKNPDIVANVVNYQFVEKYDYVLAFEVFEHIPFEDFERSLTNLQNVCTKKLLISLPRNEKVWFRVLLELPGSKFYSFRIATKRNRIITKHHHWEVDYKRYNMKYLKSIFEKHGFNVSYLRRYSLLFFTLSKK